MNFLRAAKKVLLSIMCFVLLALSACSFAQKETACTDPQCGALHWVREESQFIEYEIVDDTVVFVYANLLMQGSQNSVLGGKL